MKGPMTYAAYMTLHDCPYCHVVEGRVVSHTPRVIRCNRCGLYRLLPRMNLEGQHKYLEAHDTGLDLSNYPGSLDGGCNDEVSGLAKVFPQVFHSGRVLDVGCAEGSFTYALQKAGARATGLEPLRRLVEYGKGFGIDVRHGSFDQLPQDLSRGSFDLICLREVLYYVNDLRATFDQIRRLLNPGGGIYIKAHVASSLYYLKCKNRVSRYGIYVQGMPTKAAMEYILPLEGFKVIDSFPWPYNVAHVLGLPSNSFSGRVLNKATKRLFDSLGMYDRIAILAQKA